MTRDDVIRMAREADLLVTTPISEDSVFVADLERFAALVAAQEREACAKVCDDQHDKARTSTGAARANACAAAIRARGQA